MIFAFEDFVLDPERRELRRGGDLLAIEPQIFDLLQYLIQNRERVVSRDELIAAVWGGRIVSESTLSSRINALRCAVGDNGRDQRVIRTFSKKGIRFVAAVEYTKPGGAKREVWSRSMQRPSIAILPLSVVDQSRRLNQFGTGLTEQIIAELSRCSDVCVVARHASFQNADGLLDVRQAGHELGAGYILHGSVRRAHASVRVTVYLADASLGVNCWAERYDLKLDDAFGAQDRVTKCIATTVVAQLNNAEADNALAKPAASLTARDFYLLAARARDSFWLSWRAKDLYKTRDLLVRSLKIDANNASAHALLADTYIMSNQVPLDGDYLNPRAIARARQFADKAVECDPRSPLARSVKARALTFQRNHSAAVKEIDCALALDPNYTDWRFPMLLVIAGDHERAIDAAQKHMCADPTYPDLAVWWLGTAYYMLNNYSAALPHLREAASRASSSSAVHLHLAANYSQLQRHDEARAEVALARQVDPKICIELQSRLAAVCRDEQDVRHHLDGLRKAGLPSS